MELTLEVQKILNELNFYKELLNREAKNKSELAALFTETCVNSFPAIKYENGEPSKPLRYRREDLSEWAEEAFANGESCFYASPVDPEKPNGKLKLAEPEYQYKLLRNLTQTEYETLKSCLRITND